jgi:hypothetical protein
MMACSAVIWLDKDHRSNTYCMREQGHTGEHNIDGKMPVKEAQSDVDGSDANHEVQRTANQA